MGLTGLAGAAPVVAGVSPHSSAPSVLKKVTFKVSPAILDAAHKGSDELLQDLRTAACGLTESEANDRALTTGPNELAQEKPQGWPIRLLKIIRNPLVILLAALSAISFATGDARAGTVMAMMVLLSVGLRFLQEARADAAAAKLKAMIHMTSTVTRDGHAREIPLRDRRARVESRGHRHLC
jgi:P-type Mg2+ transporter